MSKAMVVLSGGQDSTTCLFWAKQMYSEVEAISFDYGQRHIIELASAGKIAEMAGVKHQIVQVAGLLKSASPLTSDTPLEQYCNAAQMDAIIGNRVEKTFVPMRNTLFLTVAANYALAAGADRLVTGICQADNANYPDCTEQFRALLESTINVSLGLKTGEFKILAPLMCMSKAQSIAMAVNLPGCMEALAYSHTSYDGKYPPTDMNHANVLRAAGFEEAGVPDPLVVRAYREGLMSLPATANYDQHR
jgi:7-cyano-7-deazaguanine synthase